MKTDLFSIRLDLHCTLDPLKTPQNNRPYKTHRNENLWLGAGGKMQLGSQAVSPAHAARSHKPRSLQPLDSQLLWQRTRAVESGLSKRPPAAGHDSPLWVNVLPDTRLAVEGL